MSASSKALLGLSSVLTFSLGFYVLGLALISWVNLDSSSIVGTWTNVQYSTSSDVVLQMLVAFTLFAVGLNLLRGVLVRK